ncbi:MAG: hypothetical protein A2Z14_19830 [Chloroflexi bacterium RBG_16_48_8]|nr:MAG: hypothetical protein A2Z14_19830 [Chloroflexi bacterium RBG_16_48_8]
MGVFETSLRLKPYWLCVEKVQIPFQGFESAFNGHKIVQFNDIHLSPHTKIDVVQPAIEIPNNLKRNLLVITGDYVRDVADDIFDLASGLAQLNATYKVYSISGTTITGRRQKSYSWI